MIVHTKHKIKSHKILKYTWCPYPLLQDFFYDLNQQHQNDYHAIQNKETREDVI